VKLWMFIIVILVLMSTPFVKGLIGEMFVALFLKLLNKDIYRVYHDLYIPKEDGTTTQIDHVITSPYGIFVVETKNYKGWIFGDEKSKNWTQVIYKKKSYFYNPIRQNHGHIRHLKKYLVYPNKTAYIFIIAFSMRATLKKVSTTTKVLYSPILVLHIKKYKDVLIEPKDLMRVNETLSTMGRASFKTRRDHVKYIKTGKKPQARIDNQKNNPEEVQSVKGSEELICPKCGSDLIERNGKRGAFMACSGYPKCRYTMDI